MKNVRKSYRNTLGESRRRRVLLYIHEFIVNNEYCPDIREIGAAVDITSTSVTNYYLKQLRKWDLIDFKPRLSRTIHLTALGKEQVAKWMQPVNKSVKLHDNLQSVTQIK